MDTRLHISGGCFIDGKSQCNVFRNRQGIQQIKVLKHKAKILPAKPGNGLGLYLRNIRSSQIDVSCAHGAIRGNTVEQSRLPRAGSAHNAQELTSFYRKANISDRFFDISLIATVFLDIHYFDISDTHPSKYSRPVPIWEMKPEYEQEITETLESTFGMLNNSQYYPFG